MLMQKGFKMTYLDGNHGNQAKEEKCLKHDGCLEYAAADAAR